MHWCSRLPLGSGQATKRRCSLHTRIFTPHLHLVMTSVLSICKLLYGGERNSGTYEMNGTQMQSLWHVMMCVLLPIVAMWRTQSILHFGVGHWFLNRMGPILDVILMCARSMCHFMFLLRQRHFYGILASDFPVCAYSASLRRMYRNREDNSPWGAVASLGCAIQKAICADERS